MNNRLCSSRDFTEHILRHKRDSRLFDGPKINRATKIDTFRRRRRKKVEPQKN